MQSKFAGKSSFLDNFKPKFSFSGPKALGEEESPVEATVEAVQSEFQTIDFNSVRNTDMVDERLGFSRYLEGEARLGWLINIHQTLVDDSSCPDGSSGVDLYFLQDDGSTFKATILFNPYLYVLASPGTEAEVEEYIKRRFQKNLKSVAIVEKEDLDLSNHLIGKRSKALKLEFFNNNQFKSVKNALSPLVERNSKLENTSSVAMDTMFSSGNSGITGSVSRGKNTVEAGEAIIGLREYDISYYCRTMIDNDIRVGLWYNVKAVQGTIILEPRQDIVHRPDPVILAFDIETTKLPLRFPDAAFDNITMISYMIDGEGFLITNREIVSKDIDDFEFTPKPEYEGAFTIFNEENECALLKRFFDHIRAVKPTVFVTYNGDFFDWPFIEKRSLAHNLDLYHEIGFQKNAAGEYLSSYGAHMDCFCWVKRDSYLPQGSQGLKAVAKYKLGYDPVELDPELMTRYAAEQPQVLAEYSVSDAVATYYLYMKYVHPFTFSLCNIIPMNPDDVLRRGSGTLCEHLLMVQSFKANVIMPNKHVDKGGNFFSGHMLNSETYVGGHVEALEAGVFRSDLPTKFNLSPDAFQQLIDEIDQALVFSIEKEGHLQLDQIVNYEAVRNEIVSCLQALLDNPIREECPSIYHLDVGAMYPNIILTNRLQPDAIVDDTTCASCDFNQGPDSSCQRKMTWTWRGEHFMASKGEYNMLRNQIEQETFPGKRPDQPPRHFHELPRAEQDALLKKRMGDYSQKVYGKKFSTKVVEKQSIVCQRENPFYVNTVRDFRDRRYQYKALLKKWKKDLEVALSNADAGAIDKASKMTVIYDSLQTAHKCILNSFYGYVMRKAARWYSMEMAGIVCLTGAKIIQLARQRVEKIGKPLELDTDGIWCVLPKSFPENFTFDLGNGKSYTISYPCVMLNHLVHDQFTNDQYQELDPETGEYVMRSENSIFFEVDGPYRAMILPASLEEDKLLKKRYAVFNHDGTIAELKGFELKRRGELQLIKNFQGNIFKVFLEGSTLAECYNAVGNATNNWLDILWSKGADLTDAELFDLVGEKKNMSKTLESYGAQKSTSITTAKRLAELLGEQMVQDKGLNCHFIICHKPQGAPVSERAIPLAIFQSEKSVKQHYLRKWLKDNSIVDVDIRDLVDWEYYKERFGSVVQKLITIPAGLQDVPNPIPRILHPEWLLKRTKADKHRQLNIMDAFKKVPVKEQLDIEDIQLPRMPSVPIESLVYEDGDVAVEVKSPSRPTAAPVVRLPNGKRRLRSKADIPVLKTVKGVKLKRLKRKPFRAHPEPPIENPFDILTEYKQWVEAQFPIWQARLKQSKQINGSNQAKVGISTYFENSATKMINTTWEILQISETDSLGIFRVWAIVNNALESIDIEVPRLFYLNSRVPERDDGQGFANEEITISRKGSTLPRNHQSLNLYEFKMSELYYQNSSSLFASIFNHKDIEGVYETQVPLLFRALLKIGAFASSKVPAHLFDRNKPLPLDQIQTPSIAASNYLQGNSFSLVYIFHSHSGSKEYIGVFNPSTATMHTIIVDSGRNRDAIPPIKRTYIETKKTVDLQQLQSNFIIYPENLDSSTPSVVANEKEAFILLNRLLLSFKSAGGQPVMLFLQSTKSLKYYRNSNVAAFREFPVMLIPTHKSDYSFPTIGWQKYALDRLLINLFNLPMFLQNRIELARYGNVPVCNIETDFTVFLSDLFFARRLKSMDQLLWCSPSSKPDLGGSEQDDHRAAVHDLKCPDINTGMTSETIAIEIELWDLALNTIVKSFEFSDGFDQSIASSTSKGSIYRVDSHFSANGQQDVIKYDQESTHHAFATLRAMVKDWIAETKAGNPFAGNITEHLHRWITSTSALLYDDLIVAQIHNMMKKALASIIDELKRLGSTIIFASFDKIILSTTKTTLKAGAGYIAYVLESIKRNPSYQHVDLNPSVFWDYLVWYDAFNHGGLVYRNVDGTTDITSIEEMEINVDFQWNIAEFLPAPVQHEFLTNVAEYFDAIRSFKERGQPLNKAISAFIEKQYLHQLIPIVKNINKHRIESNNEEYVQPRDNNLFHFPKLPGSCRKMDNPALEFIKMITMILMLNSSVLESARKMKKSLLTIIDVKEFSSSAVFSNPCEKYILPQVICHYCSYGCDLDLTRKEGNTIGADNIGDMFLMCEQCAMLYDREDIEQRLIQDLEGLLCKWQLQDVVCTNSSCREVQAVSLRNNCSKCTGALKTVLDRDQYNRQIHVLANLADFFRMELLREATSFVQAMK